MPRAKSTKSNTESIEIQKQLPDNASYAISVYRKNGLWAASLMTLVNGAITTVDELPEDSKGVVLAKATNWLKHKLDQ